MPIFALRCKLENIVPEKGAYSPDFIDRMKRLLIDQRVKIEVTRKNTTIFPLAVIMHLTENTDHHKGNLARIFVNEGAARTMMGRNEWYDPKAVQEQEDASFNIQPTTDKTDLPEEFYEGLISASETFPKLAPFPTFKDALIPVKDLRKYDYSIFVTLGDCYDHINVPQDIVKEIEFTKEIFKVMSIEIQALATTLPYCSSRYVFPGHSYLAKFNGDNDWYRLVLNSNTSL